MQLRERMERMVRMVAEAFGAEATFTWTPGNAALHNDPACAARAQKSIAAVLGPQALAHYEGTLSGEDFSEYLHEVPGVFAFVGARNPEVGADYPQHSCFYNIDESVLVGGSMVAAQYAHDYLAGE